MTSQFRSERRKEPFGKPNGEKTGVFARFLPFFRPWIFTEFHRSLLPFSMLCPDSDSRKGLFASSQKQSVLRRASDLRRRRTAQKVLRSEKPRDVKGFRSKGQKLTNGWKPVRGKQKSDHRMRWSDFCCETNTTGSAGSSKILSLIQKS